MGVKQSFSMTERRKGSDKAEPSVESIDPEPVYYYDKLSLLNDLVG